jgi:hypothetical protein
MFRLLRGEPGHDVHCHRDAKVRKYDGKPDLNGEWVEEREELRIRTSRDFEED